MSRYMQIDIRLVPFYEKGFAEHFQGIASLFKKGGYQKKLDDASLYLIVDYLADMARNPDVSPDIKEQIAPYVIKMKALKERAREKLLLKKLEELDQLLYQIEDQFEELEKNI